MSLYEIAERYTKALFSLKATHEEMERRDKILTQLALNYKKEPDFKRFFLNPQISKTSKEKVLKEAIQEDEELISFILLLVEKGKLGYLKAIAHHYHKLLDEKSDRLTATIIASRELDSTLKNKLKELLEKTYKKSVSLQEEIRPQILGGAVLIIENQMFDFSLKSRLEALRKTLEHRE